MYARLFVKSFAAFTYLGGLALIIAGIVNIVHLHDRAGGTTGIVLGSLFMLAGMWVWQRPLANEPPRWRIRKVKVPQTSSGRSVVGKHRMNNGVPSIRRKMMMLGLLAPILLATGVASLIWCRRSGMTYCRGGGLVVSSVYAIIGVIYLYRRRDESGEDG